MCPVDLPPRYSPSSRLVGGRLLRVVKSRMPCTMRCRIWSPAALIRTSLLRLVSLPPAIPAFAFVVTAPAHSGTLEHMFKTILAPMYEVCQEGDPQGVRTRIPRKD